MFTCTIGCDVCMGTVCSQVRTLDLSGQAVKLFIYDTAGQVPVVML